MNAKQTKQHKQIRQTVVVILLALLILAAIVAAVLLLSDSGSRSAQDAAPEAAPETQAPSETQAALSYDIPGYTPVQQASLGTLEGGLELVSVGRYTGPYFEDGSDEQVSDVYAVILRNDSGEWVDFAAVTMTCGAHSASFELSSLPADAAVLVLEADRLQWQESDFCQNPHAVLTDDPGEYRFDFDDDFKLYPADGVLNLQNISDRTFENDILVCYKSFDYGLFLGGVTYRARFGGLAPEQIGQSMQPHYSDARSLILYLRYDD